MIVRIIKLFITLWLCNVIVAISPTVKVKNGILEGSSMQSRNGRQFFAFRGIPFALPPIDNLRFKDPKPAVAWEGVRSAKSDGAMCIQKLSPDMDVIGSEDCLYLNVFTPELLNNVTKNIRISHPVMIWFHGGAWAGGSGHSEFFSPIYFLDNDVVLVTVNYRLGPLGFLSTEDMASPGNQGLKDQVQSMKWVRENIANFGGDPNRITIFGGSAGGASVHYHMISHSSSGLFHRGISQSGTALSFWAVPKPGVAKENAKRLGKYLDCPTSSSVEIIACLRKKDAVEIINMYPRFLTFGMDPIVSFGPVIELEYSEAFLTGDPVFSLENGIVNDVPWIVGINSHEGGMRVEMLYESTERDSIKELNDNWLELAPISLTFQNYYCQQYHEEISKNIWKYYLGDQIIDASSKFNLIDMYSDSWFNFGTHMSVKHHIKTLSNPVYYYYFSYEGEFLGDKKYGVSHGEESFYLFPMNKRIFNMKDEPTVRDKKMIDLLTNMWFNFARTGNPTPEITERVPVKWEPVITEELEYLSIGQNNPVMRKNLLRERMEFWGNMSDFRKCNSRYVKTEL